MFQDFEVKTLFEGQVHERHQFTLNIEGHNYQGIFHVVPILFQRN